jgi:2-polyprenyl-6-hydroxyphenyl methylase/3-demethylubiquinone-9 3-methyltransferase
MSVACTAELRRRYFPDDSDWIVEQGSALDRSFLATLGRFDVVYSWGVLHHTGAMWDALENVVPLVVPGGRLCLAIYNDQGAWSRYWKTIKRVYNQLPPGRQPPYAAAVMGTRELRSIAIALLRGAPTAYIRTWTGHGEGKGRGMSRFYDMIDWVGGYPFEVARPEEIFNFFHRRGFSLECLRTSGGGLGCNELAFALPVEK